MPVEKSTRKVENCSVRISSSLAVVQCSRTNNLLAESNGRWRQTLVFVNTLTILHAHNVGYTRPQTTREALGIYLPIFGGCRIHAPDIPVTPSASTLKRVPTMCLLPDELESWNPSSCVLCHLLVSSSQCLRWYHTSPVLYGQWGRTLVLSSIRVARLNINIGRTNLETRGETRTTLAKVPSADLDLPVFGRRRFKYPISGGFLSR